MADGQFPIAAENIEKTAKIAVISRAVPTSPTVTTVRLAQDCPTGQ